MASASLRLRALVPLLCYVALGFRSTELEGAHASGSKTSFQVAGAGRPFASLLEQQNHVIAGGNANPSASAPQTLAGSSFLQQEGKDLSDLFRMSVVRIMSITKPVNFFQPFFPMASQQAVGSGFAVEPEPGKPSANDPVFITNAHVVRNAHTVQVQLPAMGLATFDAYVPLIYEDFDLAVVRLVRPEEFIKAVEAQNFTLKVLPVSASPVTLGLEVVAVGFPLGSDSLKLSRGVIAGTELVSGGVCFQSTAPISPGNSGGPLFALGDSANSGEAVEDLKVIGVNFAAAVAGGAQNVNYVIAIVHIQQVLNEFRQVENQRTTAEKEGGQAQEKQQELLKLIASKLPKGVNVKASIMADSSIALQVVPGPGMSKEKVAADQEQVKKIAADAMQEMKAQGNHTHASSFSQLQVVSAGPSDGAASVFSQLKSSSSAMEVQQASTAPSHHRLRIAPIDMLGTEGNSALYKSSGEDGKRCEKGIYISKIGKKSALRFATPSSVPEGTFLTAVNGWKLDSFGMGRTKFFLGDPLPFESIMGIGESLDDPVKLTVCQKGIESDYTISMVWNATYDTAIKGVTEPYFEPEALDYEHFADITVMQMTQNHVLALIKEGSASLGRMLTPENQEQPRLLVVDVKQGSYAGRNVQAGMVLDKINGIKVSTLADYRAAFEPNGTEFWTMETDLGLMIQQYFETTLSEQVQLALQVPEFSYLITKAVRKAALARAQNDTQQQLDTHATDTAAAEEAMQNYQDDNATKAREGENKPERVHPMKQSSFAELAPLLNLLPEPQPGIKIDEHEASFASAGEAGRSSVAHPATSMRRRRTIAGGVADVPQASFLRATPDIM